VPELGFASVMFRDKSKPAPICPTCGISGGDGNQQQQSSGSKTEINNKQQVPTALAKVCLKKLRI